MLFLPASFVRYPLPIPLHLVSVHPAPFSPLFSRIHLNSPIPCHFSRHYLVDCCVFYLIMWLATPLPSFRPAVRPAQTQTRAAVTSAAFWATGTWSSAGTDRSSACSWRSPPAKCDFLSHVAGDGRRPGAGPSPFDARDGPLDGRRRRQGHGGAAGAVRGQGVDQLESADTGPWRWQWRAGSSARVTGQGARTERSSSGRGTRETAPGPRRPPLCRSVSSRCVSESDQGLLFVVANSNH